MSDHAVVVAGGCYCVDLESQEISFTLASPSYTDVIAIPNTSRAALADFDAVTIIDTVGVEWTTPRIAWDGVRFTAATERNVIGVAETGHGAFDERSFQIDLAKREVTGGYVHIFRR